MVVSFMNLLVSIGRSFADLARESKKEKRETNDRLANLLDKISECLESTASSIRAGGDPYLQCDELGIYLLNLRKVIGNKLSKADADNLEKYLEIGVDEPGGWTGYRFEYEIIGGLDSMRYREKENRASRIEEIAGIFRGTANILKAKD